VQARQHQRLALLRLHIARLRLCVRLSSAQFLICLQWHIAGLCRKKQKMPFFWPLPIIPPPRIFAPMSQQVINIYFA